MSMVTVVLVAVAIGPYFAAALPPAHPHYNHPKGEIQQPPLRHGGKAEPHGPHGPHGIGEGHQRHAHLKYNPYKHCCMRTSEPVRNTPLFAPGECPAKSSLEICQQVNKLYGKVNTAMYVLSSNTPLRSRGHRHDGSFYEGHFEVETKAAAAVSDHGCCFNVYPAVDAHQRLSPTCSDPLLYPDEDPSSLLQYYSIGTAGHLGTTGPMKARSVEGGCLIGGDWKAPGAVKFAARERDNLVPFFVGGRIIRVDDPKSEGITLVSDSGDAQLAHLDLSGRAQFDYQIISKEAAEHFRASIAHTVCVLSHRLAGLKPNASVVYATNTVIIDCKGEEFCVAELDIGDILRTSATAPLTIKFENTKGQVVINVFGRTADFPVVTIAAIPTILNFVNAAFVRMGFRADGATLIAPVAKTMYNAAGILGGSYMGRLDSELFLDGTVLRPKGLKLTLPPPPPKVTYCGCLCEE